MERRKKRKLPRDLFKATEEVTSTIRTTTNFIDAHALVKDTSLSDIQDSTTLTTEQVTTWLVAHYGMEVLDRLCTVMSGLPVSLTESQRGEFINRLTGREDAVLIIRVIETRCPNLCTLFG